MIEKLDYVEKTVLYENLDTELKPYLDACDFTDIALEFCNGVNNKVDYAIVVDTEEKQGLTYVSCGIADIMGDRQLDNDSFDLDFSLYEKAINVLGDMFSTDKIIGICAYGPLRTGTIYSDVFLDANSMLEAYKAATDTFCDDKYLPLRKNSNYINLNLTNNDGDYLNVKTHMDEKSFLKFIRWNESNPEKQDITFSHRVNRK